MAVVAFLGVGLTVSACGSGDGSHTAESTSEELTGGNGIFVGEASSAGPALDAAGYVQQEYVASGTATSYTSMNGLPTDGRFDLQEDLSADYRTRIVVRRPASRTRFNGTVIVEWLNVSGGVDADPDYAFMADEILRGGYAWVGVSAQLIGVEGGNVAVSVPGVGDDLPGKGLKKIDPVRYGTLNHPGDAFSYDIYTQVAQALRSSNASGLLGDLEPARIIAAGESQSAFALTTYINGVQPLTGAFDGFIVHSRGKGPAPLGRAGGAINIVAGINGAPTIIRTDTDAPVLIVETETDITSIIGYYPSRQDDSRRIRLWEIAGTAHADRFLLGPIAELLDCGAPVNDGPQRFVIRAALRALDTWVRTGQPPPSAPRLEVEVDSGIPVIRRDADGIALGGIRTPQVDVPVAALSGEPGSSPSVICLLLGSTMPFSEQYLAELYTDRDAYVAAYGQAADIVIEQGFVLADDRSALLADAEPDLIPE